jgi:PAS fold
MADILRDGIPVIDQEVVIERPDGSRGVALVNIRPPKDAAGNIAGAVNCFYDITERKQIDQEYVLTRGQVEELTVNWRKNANNKSRCINSRTDCTAPIADRPCMTRLLMRLTLRWAARARRSCCSMSRAL